MIQINPKMIHMTQDEKQLFNEMLQSFYKSALYDDEEFEEFNSGFQKINRTTLIEDFENLKNLSEYIKTFICKNNNFENKKGIFKNAEFKLLDKTSKILSILLIKKPDLLKDFKQGGSSNFSRYICFTLAEKLEKDYTVKILLKSELQEILKSAKQIQYFRHNPPDQLFKI